MSARDIDAETRTFDDFFRELRRGGALYEAGEKLRDLVAAVERTGKGGSLTIKLSIQPDGKYGTAVEVSDQITTKLPEPKRDSSLFFMDGSHNLTRNNPDQMTFPTEE